MSDHAGCELFEQREHLAADPNAEKAAIQIARIGGVLDVVALQVSEDAAATG
jgi:hypothetical protein